MRTLKKLWWFTLLRGILLLILAFLVFGHPTNALMGVVIFIGVILLIIGVLQTGVSIGFKDLIPNWGWVLAGGLIDIVFGVVLLSNLALTAAVLPFVIGFWIIVSGIISFVESFQSKKEGNSLWGLSMLGGLLSVIFGYFVMSNVIIGALTITIWIGIGFAIAGIVNIVVAFGLKSLYNDI